MIIKKGEGQNQRNQVTLIKKILPIACTIQNVCYIKPYGKSIYS